MKSYHIVLSHIVLIFPVFGGALEAALVPTHRELISAVRNLPLTGGDALWRVQFDACRKVYPGIRSQIDQVEKIFTELETALGGRKIRLMTDVTKAVAKYDSDTSESGMLLEALYLRVHDRANISI